ncbi:MAG: HAD-IA family hydrolase [Mariniphaga sp.]|nr:HAD-IA family hydrolase [Mariniphaga sp.]MDD4425913.1 HAD-IA family hydrolase [Mariniphaga sp.]
MEIKVHPGARALIFDLDGTLSNSLPVHLATWNVVGDLYGFRFDPQILQEMTGRATIEFARHVVNRYKLSVAPEVIVKLKQQAFWDSAELLEPINEITSIVREYFGKLPMAVGTGASRRSTDVQLKQLQLAHFFDAIVSADDVTRHKPHPDTFLECARLLAVAPETCQVFEDGDLGLEAAQVAGMIVTDVRPYINYGEWLHP